MGASSQLGHIAFRTQASPAVFPADFATACIAMKLKTGALGANRSLLIPDPEIGGGRDIGDAFLGAVTYSGNYDFYVRLVGLMTLLYSALGVHVQGPAGTNDVQTIGHTGTITGGTFTLTFAAQTTAAIPWNATPSQVQTALAALSSIGDFADVVCTGTQLPAGTVTVTFDGALNGTTTALTATSAGLTGTSPIVTITHTTTGVSNAAGIQHVFVPSDAAQLPFLGIEEQISGGPVFDLFQYTDGVVNTFHLESNADGYLSGTVGMIARIQTAGATPTDVSNLTDIGDLLVGTNITVQFGGVTLAAKTFKFDLDNQIASDDFRLGSFIVGDLTPKRRVCKVGVTIREQDKTLWRQAVYGSSAATTPGGTITKQNVLITAQTFSTITGSSPTISYSISILIPVAALEPYALKVSGDDVMDDDIVFDALRPALSSPLVKVKIVNLATVVA